MIIFVKQVNGDRLKNSPVSDPANPEVTHVHKYYYDALGRRIAKTVDVNGAAPNTTLYLHDAWRVIEERSAAAGTFDQILSATVSIPTSATAQYAYGLYIDEPLVMWRDLNGDGDFEDANEVLYYHTDDQFSVLALTNASGQVVERYDYGDYGSPQICDASGAVLAGATHSLFDNPYLYTGRAYDDETGLHYYRTRYLDPQIGRFTTEDSIGIWGDIGNHGNGYNYCGNNPWTLADPYGEQGPMIPAEYADAVAHANDPFFDAFGAEFYSAWSDLSDSASYAYHHPFKTYVTLLTQYNPFVLPYKAVSCASGTAGDLYGDTEKVITNGGEGMQEMTGKWSGKAAISLIEILIFRYGGEAVKLGIPELPKVPGNPGSGGKGPKSPIPKQSPAPPVPKQLPNPVIPPERQLAPPLDPKAEATFAEKPTFGPVTHDTLFRVEGGKSRPYGGYYGIVKPDCAANGEILYNVTDYGNLLTEISTYTTNPGAMGWYGPVKGGTGFQYYFGFPRTEYVTKIKTEPLPQSGF